MVRLGATTLASAIASVYLSIPAWYDWEFQAAMYCDITGTFNSSMVRLGVKNAVKSLGNTFFQFQHGTIGRLNGLDGGYNDFVSFNSSMVRLGVLRLRYRSDLHNSFNSSMVRLGVEGRWIRRVNCIIFQFQHGTIGRLTLQRSEWNLPHFQFQHGTIGRHSRISDTILD